MICLLESIYPGDLYIHLTVSLTQRLNHYIWRRTTLALPPSRRPPNGHGTISSWQFPTSFSLEFLLLTKMTTEGTELSPACPIPLAIDTVSRVEEPKALLLNSYADRPFKAVELLPHLHAGKPRRSKNSKSYWKKRIAISRESTLWNSCRCMRVVN